MTASRGVDPPQVDLYGPFVRLRLVNASDDDVTEVARDLGLALLSAAQHGDPPDQEPDLVVTFESGPVLPVERGGRPARRVDEVTVVTDGEVLTGPVAMTIADVARGSHLRCSRGAGIPPELGELLTLCALEAGGLPIHATALAFGRRGVAVTGPSGAGKTGVLLAALARGAGLVAAEHVVVAPDGSLHGRRQAVRARPRHRHQLPPAARAIHGRRLTAWHPVTSAVAPLTRRLRVPARVADRLRDIVRDRAIADISPDAFRTATGPLDLDTLVLMRPTAGTTRMTVSALSADEAAGRLTALLAGELSRLRNAAEAVSSVADRPGVWSLDRAEAAYRGHAESLLEGRRLLLVRTPQGELPSTLAAELVDHIIEPEAAPS